MESYLIPASSSSADKLKAPCICCNLSSIFFLFCSSASVNDTFPKSIFLISSHVSPALVSTTNCFSRAISLAVYPAFFVSDTKIPFFLKYFRRLLFIPSSSYTSLACFNATFSLLILSSSFSYSIIPDGDNLPVKYFFDFLMSLGT